MSESSPISLRPIGVVRRRDNGQFISVHPPHRDGLLCIETAKKLQVLYWMHRLDNADRKIHTAHPMGERDRPERGVFALRSPMRPNPIGSTVVDLIERTDEGVLVRGLDALDGSPVIDIKFHS